MARRRRLTFIRSVGRKTSVYGGISKGGHAYFGVSRRSKIGRLPISAKASLGTKGAIVGGAVGKGSRKVGIDYNLTTKSPRLRMKRKLRIF